MSEVKIKLTSDVSGIQNDIKLVDRELSKLNGKKNTNTGSSTTSKGDSSIQKEKYSDTESLIPEKALEDLTKEVSLLRREISKTNNYMGHFKGGDPSTRGKTPYTPTGGGDSTTNVIGGGGGGKVLGTIAKAFALLEGAKVLNGFARQNQDTQSLAYQVLGKTSAYSNYNQARSDYAALGNPYGMNARDTLVAADNFMATGGYRDQRSHQEDVDSLLRTSKINGLDANQYGSFAGGLIASGAFKHGEVDKIGGVLATSIQKNGMTGREDEQLKVLESMNDYLATMSSSVSKDGMGNMLGLYDSLVAQNQDLKGARGGKLVEQTADIMNSKDPTIDILMGMGTTFTGVAGRLQLRRMQETDPIGSAQLMMQNAQRFGVPEDHLKNLFSEQHGMKVTQVDDLFEALKKGDLQGAEKIYNDASKGENVEDNKMAAYTETTIAKLEKFDANIENIKENTGGILNELKGGFAGIFNRLGTGTQTALVAGGSLLGGMAVNKGLSSAGKSLSGKIRNYTTGKDATSGAKKVNGMEDIASGASKGASKGSKGLNGLKGLKHSDDVVDGSKALLNASKVRSVSKGAKGLGLLGLGLDAITTTMAVSEANKRGDSRAASSALGGGIGSFAGGSGGAAMGAAVGTAILPGIGTAIGGILGGIGGSLLGESTGTAVGELAHDNVKGSPKYTDDTVQSIVAREREKVQKIYDTQGSARAREYTNRNVVPLLNSAGVSTSITDKYKFDIGKNDFLKDVDNGVFGNIKDYKKTKSDELAEESLTSQEELIKSTDNLAEIMEGLSGSSVNGSKSKNGRVGSTPMFNAFQNNKSAQNAGANPAVGDASEDYAASASAGGGENSDTASSSSGNSKKHTGILGFLGDVWSNIKGTHYSGHPNIPYDNYLAELHKGEMVLNKHEAEMYRQGRVGDKGNSNSTQSLNLNINISGNIQGLDSNNQDKVTEALVNKLYDSDLVGVLSNGYQRIPNY